MRIAVSDLDLRYGDLIAARKITFDVRPGEFVSLIGPSGCGKSSVLRALGGLQPPSGGEITIDGDRVRGPQPTRMAYVFQDLALFPWRTARRNVEVPLELRGVPRKQRRERAEQLLARVGLTDAADQHPAQLSGGMRQRVAIARALACDAGILLLDEPFAALDEQTRLRLGGELRRLLEEEGKTVVFVTHSLQEAAYLSDRIVVLSPRPATVKEVITVPSPRPEVGSAEFHRLHAHLTDLLFAAEPA
ncbi:NitT/TauT family transport system ATP-binding protein [Actinoplanes tereljensis]|uniref:ATP-binding protein n=1 Tax=Paractinoplanes tereljensis TaxID=571912 RepID=A0A919TZV1_9ACTN|nr:ABC transporter ATP-binding protein [Actinoplanes tereljensis]GIF26660.1 ATP-binding protein [Actinoplanes tereljensis]